MTALDSATQRRALVTVLVVGLAGLGVRAALAPEPAAAPRRPAAVAASGAARLTASPHGTAIFRARDVAPGARVSGTVTVANAGDGYGELDLTQEPPQEAPGAGGGRLGDRLALRVEPARDPGAPVYDGPMAQLRRVGVGRLAPGERRTYRFTATFRPAGARADDVYQGSSVSTRYVWGLTAGAPPVAPPPARDPTPRPSPSPARQPAAPPTPRPLPGAGTGVLVGPPAVEAEPRGEPVRGPFALVLGGPTRQRLGGVRLPVTARCSRACTVVVEHGGVLAPRGLRRSVAAGRTVHLGLRLRPAAAARVRRALAARRPVTLRVLVRAGDGRGRTVRRTWAVRLLPDGAR